MGAILRRERRVWREGPMRREGLAPEAVLVIALGSAVDVHLVGALFQDEGGDAKDDDAREEQDADAQAGAEEEVEELVHCAVLLSCWNTWRNTFTSIYLHCIDMHRIAISPR